MAHFREYVRHRLIGTPFDSLARNVRRRLTLWQIRGHLEIRDAMLEDDFLHEIVERAVKDGDHCVDVGAHLGAMTQHFCRRSPSGKHISVEPTPHKARWLQRKYPHVDVVQAALAEAPGELTFYHQSNNSGYSGLTKHDAKLNDVAHVEVFKVRCDTLDNVAPTDRRVAFMKIDVEGAELRVLSGGRRVLTQDRPLFVFECTETGLRSAGSEARSLFELIQDVRYQIHTPRGYLEGGKPLDATTFERAIQYPYLAFSFVASPLN